jgi:hypothetical protein
MFVMQGGISDLGNDVSVVGTQQPHAMEEDGE